MASSSSGESSPRQLLHSSTSSSSSSVSDGFRNRSEVIDEPLRVTIRFKPMTEQQHENGEIPDAVKIVRSYGFDRVFGGDTTTKEVYEAAGSPIVKAAMEGINGTIFAYGETSSGKTHTMHGDQDSPGIISLAIKDVFSIIQDTPGREFLIRVSYLEIYNEVINDLLDPMGQNLQVREGSQGTYVEGRKEEVVLSPEQALSFLAAGEEHRHVGSNNFNLFSGLSHTIFTLMIESCAHGDEYDGVIFSRLNLIDLAGLESSKIETTGMRRKEGAYINKSLLTLRTVIGNVSEGKASEAPYWDSKLTHLLQSSLSGHGLISLICTVIPASSSSEETHDILKFASQAKCVEIHASCNQVLMGVSLRQKKLDFIHRSTITKSTQDVVWDMLFEPCLTQSFTLEPTLAPVAVERTMTRRAAASINDVVMDIDVPEATLGGLTITEVVDADSDVIDRTDNVTIDIDALSIQNDKVVVDIDVPEATLGSLTITEVIDNSFDADSDVIDRTDDVAIDIDALSNEVHIQPSQPLQLPLPEQHWRQIIVEQISYIIILCVEKVAMWLSICKPYIMWIAVFVIFAAIFVILIKSWVFWNKCKRDLWFRIRVDVGMSGIIGYLSLCMMYWRSFPQLSFLVFLFGCFKPRWSHIGTRK